MKYFTILTSILILFVSGCKKDKKTKSDLLTQKELLEFHQKHSKPVQAPPMPDLQGLDKHQNGFDIKKVNKKIIENNAKIKKPTFPNTLCGRLVSKLYKCELQIIDQNKELKDVFKRDIKNRKTRNFIVKKEKYLAHCRKTVAKLSQKAIEKCIALDNCKKMDKCLRKASEKLNKK